MQWISGMKKEKKKKKGELDTVFLEEQIPHGAGSSSHVREM